MKKLLLSAMLAGVVMGAGAAETTLNVKDATNFKGTYVEEQLNDDNTVKAYAHYQPCEGFEIEPYVFTLSTTSENASQAPAYYWGKDDARTVRLYTSSIIKVEAQSEFKTFVLNMSSVKGITATNNLTATAGTVTYDADAKTITWSGEATKELTLTVPSTKGDGANPNIQITSFTVSADATEPVIPPVEPADDHIYSGLISTSETCDWTFENVTKPESLETIWSWKSYQGAYYLNATAFVSNTEKYATESYAVSPVVDLTGCSNVSCTWESAAKFQTTLKDLCKFCVREEGSTAWTEVAIPEWPAAGAWTWSSCGTVDLSAWEGKKVNFAFKYGSTAQDADTWEIRNFYVNGNGAGVEGVEMDNDASARYYDLSGRAVNNPSAGLYIEVRGSKARKVVVK